MSINFSNHSTVHFQSNREIFPMMSILEELKPLCLFCYMVKSCIIIFEDNPLSWAKSSNTGSFLFNVCGILSTKPAAHESSFAVWGHIFLKIVTYFIFMQYSYISRIYLPTLQYDFSLVDTAFYSIYLQIFSGSCCCSVQQYYWKTSWQHPYTPRIVI